MNIELKKGIKLVKTFKYNSKLVGVTFEGRQAVISLLKGDEQLSCRREPENEYDKNAVAVDVLVGEEWLPIGYIAKDKNQEIAASMDAGIVPKITLANITGGDGKSFGINFEIEYAKAPEKKEAPVAAEAEAVKPSRADMKNVLEYLLGVVQKPTKTEEPRKVSSVLLGKHIEVVETDGYITLEGYMSGSKFPAQFYKEFDDSSDDIIKAMTAKYELTDSDVSQLRGMWDINSLSSTSLGNAIHYAMENYDKNYELGQRVRNYIKKPTKNNPDGVLSENKALNRNPILQKIVKSFHEKFGGDYARFNEEFIWDKGLKLCGSVDRIKVVDLKKRIIRIQDFKTDADIHETKYQLTTSPFYALTQGDNPTMGKELLDYHWLQLSFYALILQRAGWTVEGLDIYWLNGEKLVSGENPWEEFSHDVIDVSEAIVGE